MIGVRALRTDLAAHVRRAANGEPTVIAVNGRPAAILAPLAASPHVALSALIASGALVAPRREDGQLPDRTVPVWGNARLDRLLREIRG
jgi:antitoxin (DNA-binding transcriptional repressor) of toxin-antitoxin stability system